MGTPGVRIYRALLRLFPADFRRERGREMEHLFRAMRDRRLEERGRVGMTFWLRLAADTVSHAARERMRPHGRAGRRFRGGRGGAVLRWADLRLAARGLVRRPGHSALVVLMMALGIGGSTAMFRLFNGLFLRPLPFEEPATLVDLDETAPRWNLEYTGLAYPDLVNWRDGNRTFEAMGAYSGRGANLLGDGEPERVDLVLATHDLDDALRISPALGRFFTPEEDTPEGPRVALLTHGSWTTRFASDPDAVGRTVILDGVPHEVIGVLSPRAAFLADADLWVPLREDPRGSSGWYLAGVGRLLPGVTAGEAREDLTRLHRGLVEEGRAVNEITSPTVVPLADRYLGEFRLGSWVLLGAVGLVLLIACANIAGLTLARALERDREIAVRTALGASRGRIVAQLLTESFLLAGVGAGLGVALGAWASGAALPAVADNFPRFVTFDMDWRVLAFSVLLAGGAAMGFGLLPALKASGVDRGALAGSRSSAGSGKRRGMGALVVTEVALATVLLVLAGTSLQDLGRLQGMDPGYRAEGLLTYRITLPPAGYPAEEDHDAFRQRHLEELRALPGVEGATLASSLPLAGHWGWFYEAEGAPPRGEDEAQPVVLTRAVAPGYFDVMGVRLAAGRGLEDGDGRSEGAMAVVVNESFVREFFPDDSRPIGRRIRTGEGSAWLTVVGVARDVKHYGVDEDMRPGVYQPISQIPLDYFMVAVRTAGDPTALAGAVREVLRRQDPTLPVFDLQTMEERAETSLWTRRAQSWLFAAFSSVALLLAVAGLYGVVSYSVRQRVREIGIRMALGAPRRQVLGQVVRQGMALVAGGLVLGLGGALAVTRAVEGLFVAADATAMSVYVPVAVLLAVVAAAANVLPARRAAGLDPMQVLRGD